MDFVSSIGDLSNVPEFSIGGVARAEIIDNCIVRVTLFRPSAVGENEFVPACQLLWSIPAWIAARAILGQVVSEISRAGITPADVHSDAGPRHH